MHTIMKIITLPKADRPTALLLTISRILDLSHFSNSFSFASQRVLINHHTRTIFLSFGRRYKTEMSGHVIPDDHKLCYVRVASFRILDLTTLPRLVIPPIIPLYEYFSSFVIYITIFIVVLLLLYVVRMLRKIIYLTILLAILIKIYLPKTKISLNKSIYYQ
jgi:hypothetical protein